MKRLDISEVRNTLPALIESVSRTRAPVVLLRYGTFVAMLVPVADRTEPTNPYPLRGSSLSLSADFDAPLPDLWEV